MAEMAEKELPPWKYFLTAGILYAVLLCVVTWPLICVASESFIGDVQSDFWKHSWGHWWVKESLSQGVLPLFCTILNAPSGGYLFIADPFNCLTVGILLNFFPLVISHNICIIINVWAGCMALWLLAKYFVKDDLACLAAGCVYGLSAYVIAYPVISGVTETLNTAWIPLFFLFLHRAKDTGSFKDTILTGVFFALTTVSCWYYGEFMIVYCAVILVSKLLENISLNDLPRLNFKSSRARQKIWERAGKSLSKALSAVFPTFLKISAALCLGLVLISPLAVMFQLVVEDPANIVMPDRAPVRSLFRFKDYLGTDSPWSVSARGIHGFHNHTNLLGLFLPGKGNATVTVTIDRLTRVHYLGWIALVMAFIAVKKRKLLSEDEQKSLKYWLWVGLFFIILSFGPRIIFSDFSGKGIANPLYLAMFWFFPMFHKVAIPFRFLALSLICLGILASFGLKILLQNQPKMLKYSLSLFVPLTMVLEIALVSPLPWPVPTSPSQIPAVYHMIAQEPGNFAIIDYPFERPSSQLIPGEYYYYQTFHKKAIPYRTSGVLSNDVARNHFMEELLSAQSGLPPTANSEKRLRQGAKRLSAMGFKYLILHQHLLDGFSLEQIQTRLLPILGAPAEFDDGVLLYTMKASESHDN